MLLLWKYIWRPKDDLNSNQLLKLYLYYRWFWKMGQGGLFDALSARSMQPQPCYEQAGRTRDLTLGDAHLIPIGDLQSRGKGRDMVRKL